MRATERTSRPGPSVVDAGVTLVVPVEGELDVATAPALRQRLIDTQTVGRTIVVDQSGVTFIDASDLGVLVAALKRARAKGGELMLRDPAPLIARVHELTRVETVCRIERNTT